MTVNLGGWKAIIVILAILGFSVFKYQTSRRTLEPKVRQIIRLEMAAEYLQLAKAELEIPLPEGQEAKSSEMLKNIERIEFKSLSARGKDDDIVARAEILVDGKVPAGKKPVRYFRMEYSVLTGWRYLNETSAMVYYLKFF
ncbi:MAG: hypothetical protein COT17_05565 [Elusimicrobia bacterium CG08_land_8_20_14_0_20_51_18]|nr:MAG: hypothetical protein COT17_05565 [Elusimicrobia bacterium CG08_land_8_20_14_0_20_51_18]